MKTGPVEGFRRVLDIAESIVDPRGPSGLPEVSLAPAVPSSFVVGILSHVESGFQTLALHLIGSIRRLGCLQTKEALTEEAVHKGLDRVLNLMRNFSFEGDDSPGTLTQPKMDALVAWLADRSMVEEAEAVSILGRLQMQASGSYCDGLTRSSFSSFEVGLRAIVQDLVEGKHPSSSVDEFLGSTCAEGAGPSTPKECDLTEAGEEHLTVPSRMDVVLGELVRLLATLLAAGSRASFPDEGSPTPKTIDHLTTPERLKLLAGKLPHAEPVREHHLPAHPGEELAMTLAKAAGAKADIARLFDADVPSTLEVLAPAERNETVLGSRLRMQPNSDFPLEASVYYDRNREFAGVVVRTGTGHAERVIFLPADTDGNRSVDLEAETTPCFEASSQDIMQAGLLSERHVEHMLSVALLIWKAAADEPYNEDEVLSARRYLGDHRERITLGVNGGTYAVFEPQGPYKTARVWRMVRAPNDGSTAKNAQA